MDVVIFCTFDKYTNTNSKYIHIFKKVVMEISKSTHTAVMQDNSLITENEKILLYDNTSKF